MDIRVIRLDDALRIRHEILWPCKPLSFCKVDGDETATHYGFYLNEELVSVASIFIEGRIARLRKFATLDNFQRRGIGSQLITYIVSDLETVGIENFWCDARITAVNFYKKFGMKTQGNEFYKSDVAYCKMSVKLYKFKTK
jgi:GNAT superfamily N-acetyltransferase